MQHVTVLLSTYNGEKYIEQQIDSILNQQDVIVALYVRDDGSTDRTRSILKKYASDSRVNIIEGDNIGYANSFLALLFSVPESDFYAFADQDDVWLPGKLSAAVSHIDKDLLDVYASALCVVNEDEQPTGRKSFANYRGNVGSILSRNRIAGCTMVFTSALRKCMLEHKNELLKANEHIGYGHDGWVLLFSSSHGGNTYIDDDSYILYRRHGGTVTNMSGGWKKRIRSELKMFWNKPQKRAKVSKFMWQLKDEAMLSNEAQTFYEVSNYRNSIALWLKMVFDKGFVTGVPIVDIETRFAMISRRY